MGVLANISIVVVLCQPAMRKNPFNLFLIAIAVCDMTLMGSYLIFKQVDKCHPYYFSVSEKTKKIEAFVRGFYLIENKTSPTT
jgi:hypothetical protein